MTDKVAVHPPPKTAKKLPFKPTALRKAAVHTVDVAADENKVEDDGLDLFRRAKEMAPIVEADRERRLKKKQKLEEERQQSLESAAKRPLDTETENLENPGVLEYPRATRTETPVDNDEVASELVTPPASKRTRLDSTPKSTSIASAGVDLTRMDDSPSTRPLRSHTKQEKPSSSATQVISLDSDDSDVDDSIQITSMPSTRPDDNIEVLGSSFAAADEDDDEFADYIRKAEEARARDQALLSAGPAGAAPKDKIEILVTSNCPGSHPCLVKFVFDKQLQLLRDTWVAYQRNKGVHLDLQGPGDVVLTWRRQKVYPYSTLLNLGIRPQGNGRATADGHSSKGLDFRDGRTRVHMEAWTLDLFHEMEHEEELRRKREASESSEAGPAEGQAPVEEVKLRVVLIARGLEDVKLTVRPETTVETLITGFRAQRSIGPDKDVGLWFDGDRLEEHVTMDEAEIDDMDTFEVHIK